MAEAKEADLQLHGNVSRHSPLLLLMASIAFTAWAGVVVWMGSAIMDQLSMIQAGVEQMDAELEHFKLRQAERTTRMEGRVDQLRELHNLRPAEHDLP